MASDNLTDRLDRIEAALSALATKSDISGLAAKADLDRIEAEMARLVGKTEGIEHDLAKNDERHAELLAAIRDLRDQMFVQGGILLRLEHRDHDADATTLALQHQIQRLERRIEALEEKGRPSG